MDIPAPAFAIEQVDVSKGAFWYGDGIDG